MMNDRIRELAKSVQCERHWTEEDIEKFAQLIVRECAEKLVQANMSNPEYAKVMDEYYEDKWKHRFD